MTRMAFGLSVLVAYYLDASWLRWIRYIITIQHRIMNENTETFTAGKREQLPSLLHGTQISVEISVESG